MPLPSINLETVRSLVVNVGDKNIQLNWAVMPGGRGGGPCRNDYGVNKHMGGVVADARIIPVRKMDLKFLRDY